MANFLNYDVYDLGLTTVHSNTTLMKLLLQTSSKSIIVIEDIDCSLNLTRKREDNDENNHPAKMMALKKKGSNVTLSDLLNFLDGIWSACSGEERIIILTANYVEKLNSALIEIRKMDKYIKKNILLPRNIQDCCEELFGYRKSSSV